MLKQTLLITIIILQSLYSSAQLNLSLITNYVYPPARGEMSDIWGYVDQTGIEYAIVGMENGVSIMDLSNSANPVEVFYSPGTPIIWRDIKVWQNTAYITNEASGGMKIIDLSGLPAALTAGDVTTYTGATYPFTSAHNFFVDENGVGFVIGSDNGVGGAIILDLYTDPLAPVEIGRYDDYYLHDLFVRGDTLWGSAINDGFFTVVDVSNPAAPVTMATQTTPDDFTHNCWLSDDGNTLFTTDEVSSGYVAAYDVSDIMNIVEIDRTRSNPGTGVIPHNAFVKGNFVVTSYYRDGITIHDATFPGNLIEVGNYDTSPAMSGDGFDGVWGVYPYLPSGIIIASDIEKGLFIFDAVYQAAAYLVGNVTDQVTTNPIDAVQVDIVTTNETTNTNFQGDYQIGTVTPGSYDVTFSKFGYISQTISAVTFTNGVTTTLDVQLVPLGNFVMTGQVIDSNSDPIPNAQVKITAPGFQTILTTDPSGNFSISALTNGLYDIYVAKWGFIPLCLSSQNLTVAGNPYVFQLETGYSDDFCLDLGWTVTGNPDSGDWEKDVPVGTTLGGDPSNPGVDSSNDCDEEAYITGNGGGSAGNDDVDDGVTILTSPIFDLSTYGDPYISFERWFFNGGGFTSPNDSLVIELFNGTTLAMIDFATESDPDLGTWASKNIRITDYISLTSMMEIRVRAMDIPSGHISEGGFDKFLITDSSGLEIVEVSSDELDIRVFPSPFSEELSVQLNSTVESLHIEIYELTTGRLVQTSDYNNTSKALLMNNFARGIYLLHVHVDGEFLKAEKVVKL